MRAALAACLARRPLVRIDTRAATRDVGGPLRPGRGEALLCVTGAAPRGLAHLPLLDTVGTPARAGLARGRRETSEEHGVAQVTLVEGPAPPSDLLGTHRLW